MKFDFKTKIFFFLLILVFAFSDFVSFVPPSISNSGIGESLKIQIAEAATSGEMTLYFHKEPSSANETYNSLNFTPAEPAAYTASALTSTTNTNATPPTSFCESSNNTGETFNQVGASAATTGNRCIGTFVSPPVGQAFTMSTTDASAAAGAIWSSRSNTAVTAAVNIYLYRWNGSGTSVVAADRIATFTGATPGTAATLSSFAAVAPANNITFAATDRIVAIVSMNVTVASSSRTVSVYFDNSAATTQSNIILKYTAIAPGKPALSGTKDDDFTTDAATTACTTGGVIYNTKWTCLQGTAASTAGAFNSGGTGAAPLGDSSNWLWLRNQTTATTAVPSNFGATPSNTFLYQPLDVGYGDGTVRTVVNSSLAYTVGTISPTTPFNHSGLVLWTSNSDYLEVQVYSDAVKGAANSAKVVLNNNGVLGTPVGINSTVSNGLYNRVWIGFQNTGGNYQAQYSTDGSIWNNLGSPVAHAAFSRVGLNAFTELNSPISSYAGAFEWFQHTFAPPPVNPDATSFINNTEGTLADGGRSSQQITVSGTNFGTGPSNGTTFAVKIGTYVVPNGNVTAWNATTIIFTIPAAATVYGGTGISGLIIRANGNDDTTPLTFYIYPNITSASANNGQIGSTITVSGDHFGVASGTILINSKIATVGIWSETSLSNVKISGQEGAANITGKIQITRSDAKTSNQYPAGNFTILAPSVTGSNPASATTGQTLTVQFSGLGIDTDVGTAPILKLSKTGQADIVGTSYVKITDYQAASVSFNLSGAITGYWKLVVVNMDTQSGSFGNETSTGFYISALAPTVTGINPGFGLDSGIASITSIIGTNFQSGAMAKLTKTAQADITPSIALTYTDSTTLSTGAFDLTGKTNGWWNVVVTNPDLQTASYGNEANSGFEIRSALPSIPVNIYQFKTNTDIAQPPTTNIAVGGGIGGQTTIYFRMDMAGGKTGELYFPQVEAKPIGASFTNTFTEGAGVMFNGTAVQGWVSIIGTDNTSYHWQARVRNSSGTSSAVSFGGNNDPNDIDVYIDNNLPVISLGTDGTCSTAAPLGNITDLSALIQWNTSDMTTGAQSVFPGSGAWAKVQVDYKKGAESWTTTALSAWENSLHQVNLSGLVPATNYTFRVRSQDYLGNEAISGECTFSTTSSRPIKTVEFFIDQETAQNSGSRITKDFSVSIPESFGQALSVKSAFIEITGISSDGVQAVNAELRRGLGASFTGTGTAYNIDSTGTTTPFTILFDSLNPNAADGNQSMADIVTGSPPAYNYTLFLNGNGVAISAFSAKLIITYSYAQ